MEEEEDDNGINRAGTKRKLTESQKTLVGELYSVCDTTGVKKVDVIKMLQHLDYDVKTRTVQDWMKRVKAGESAIREDKASGRPLGLDEDESMLLIGFILHREQTKNNASRKEAIDFVDEFLGKKMDKTTLTRFLSRYDFALKVENTSRNKNAMSYDNIATEYEQFVKMAHQLEFKHGGTIWEQGKGHKVGSIDFTYTSHQRGNVQKLIGLQGGYVTTSEPPRVKT